MKRYELTPVDGRKSFYGKAIVEIAADGTETLYSYNTAIIKRSPDGNLEKLWSGWSATTGRHIAAFCGMNKAAFIALPMEEQKHDSGGRVLTNAESFAAMMARRAAR